LILFASDEKTEGKEVDPQNAKATEFESSDDSTLEEEIPEVGTICTVRLALGERISRVHYNYTSSLRKSRWKKKYLPQGIFQ